jgi:phosphoenolpyruvate synthase/pyruvate phosphate dikinase
MNLKQAKEKLSKIEWYRQGGATKPLSISYPWYTCTEMTLFGRKILAKYEVIFFYKNYLQENYISTRSLEKIALYYYSHQVKDKNFINKLFNYWQKRPVFFFSKVVNFLLDKDLSHYSNQDLLELFYKFTRVYLDVWHESIFLDSFDYYGEKILDDFLVKEGSEIGEKELDILLYPPYLSFLQQEKLSLLMIAQKVLKNPRAIKFILKNKNYKKIAQKYPFIEKYLARHSKKYFWLHNDYAQVSYLGPQYFFRNLITILRAGDLKEEITLRNYERNLKRKKEKIFKKYNSSKNFKNTINFLAFLGNFRDARKTYNQMAGNVLHKFALEFSKRTESKIEIIDNLFNWEIKNIFKLKPSFIKEVINRPTGRFYIIKTPTTYEVIKGKDSEKINNYVRELIGRESKLEGKVAYAGFVRGRVKIIKDKNDFWKMKRGDILVASNTRPEYVPIMKIAGAIISDEGGLTCHSAIVSRELKIPCIVGVQSATIVLKDGDLVEVDANHGIVEKI